MPDGGETLRDLLQGFNSMQAQLGLLPNAGQAQGFSSLPTPPQLKHPGQVSQEATQHFTQQAETTSRAAIMPRQLPAPGVMGLMPGSPTPALPPPPQIGGAGGQYGQEFAARMQQVQAQYLSPHQAQFFAGAGGQPGFMNMPSPVFQTAPSMGVFRPGFTPPPPMHLARERPFMVTPFTPQLPPPMFQSPAMQRYQEAVTADEQTFAGVMSAAPTAARIATGGAMTFLGGALGARFGGAGRLLGMAGGAALGFGPLGGLAERGMERGIVNPIAQTRAFGRQLEGITRDFVVSGGDLNMTTGRGMATTPAIQLANRMQMDVEGGRTSGFNMRDMMSLTQQAGSMGMLDMAQSGEQIAQQMRNVAKGLKSFMRIAQEPDVRSAMQQMAQMRSMGLTIPETTVAAQNAQQFARMAGTTTQNLMATAGMPGAVTFQQMGLTGGLGMQVGMGAAGLARQAVAGGAFSPAQLALAGGTRGLQQTLTESSGAALGINFQTMALLSRNQQGQLSVDPERLRRIMSGEVSLSEQASMAASNVRRLAEQGGTSPERVITEFRSRINELRDELGRSLGPMGGNMLLIRQALNLQKEMGGNIDLGAALSQVAGGSLSQNQIRSLQLTAQSPQFWTNVLQHQQQRVNELQRDESRRRQSAREGYSLGASIREIGGEIAAPFREMGRTLSRWRGGIAEWFSDREQQERAIEGGQRYISTRDATRWQRGVAGRRAQAAVTRFVGSEDFDRALRRQTQGMGGYRAAGETTFGQEMGSLYNAVGNAFGLTALTGQAEGLRTSTMLAAARAEGGIGGWLADVMPNITSLGIAGSAARIPEVRAAMEKRYRGIMETGGAGAQGIAMRTNEAARMRKELGQAYREYTRAAGGDPDAEGAGQFQEAAYQEVAKLLEGKANLIGRPDATTKAEMQAALRKGLINAGAKPEVADQMVRDQYAALVAGAMRSAKNRGNKKIQSAAAQLLEGASDLRGRAAGDILTQTMEKLETARSDAEGALGMKALVTTSFWTGISVKKFSDEEKENFKNLLTTIGSDDAMMASILALERTGKAEDKQKADALRKQLTDKIKDPAKLGKLEDRAAQRLGDETTRQQFQALGGALAVKADAGKALDEGLKGIKARRGIFQIQAGATSLAKQGITGLEDLQPSGMTLENLQSRLETIATDTQQMRSAPAGFRRILERLQAAKSPEEKRKITAEARAFMQQRGAREQGGGVTTGGTGRGGAGEAAAQQQMDDIEKLAADALKQGGKGAEAVLAKAVPMFAKASQKLHESAELLQKTAEAQALLAKMPRRY